MYRSLKDINSRPHFKIHLMAEFGNIYGNISFFTLYARCLQEVAYTCPYLSTVHKCMYYNKSKLQLALLQLWVINNSFCICQISELCMKLWCSLLNHLMHNTVQYFEIALRKNIIRWNNWRSTISLQCDLFKEFHFIIP